MNPDGTNSFRLADLQDAQEALLVLERWFVREWSPWYGPGGQGDAKTDLAAACRSGDELPICLVALDDADQVLGTASLKADGVGSELGFGPWLSALLVSQELRGQGIGSAIIEGIERRAASLGMPAVYCSTDSAIVGGLLKRRGWGRRGEAESLRGSVEIFHLDLRQLI